MSTPKHEYETIEGTKPTTHGKHEPRTITHTKTAGSETDVSMMSEIGDGVFVAWAECRKCDKRIGACKCVGGPTEPHYIKPWRDARFERDLNTRPEPSYELIPSVIEWLTERGFAVTREHAVTKAEQVTISVVDNPHIDPDRESAAEEYRELLLGDAVTPEAVDDGLDAALTRVREARDLSNVEVDF